MAGTERYKVAGMDCGSCALTIENGMRQIPGVREVSVSFTTESMEIQGEVARDAVEQRLRELGYKLADASAATGPRVEVEHRGFVGFLRFLWTQPRLRWATLAGIAALGATVLLHDAPGRALDAVYALVIVLVGAPIFIKGFRALFFARRITIDLLMAIASIGALLIGASGEAVTVILLYTLGEALEAYSAERARDSLRSLLALQPQEATVLREHADDAHDHVHDHADHDHDHQHDHDHDHGHDHKHDHAHDHGHDHKHDHGHDHDHDHGHGHGHDHKHDHAHAKHEHHAPAAPKLAPVAVASRTGVHFHAVTVPASAVAIGDVVLVRPGQRVPVDGVIRKGGSSLNQAAVTGESMPVAKAVGDEVLAGTINGEGALEIEASRVAGDSTLARIAKLVEQAQAQRAPAERFIDRFARWYTPAVVLLATLLVAIPVLAFGQPLLDSADGTHGWLYRGLALLIVACPCALVISIPVTVVSALTRLANLGILVKGGAQLDALADVKAVAFDKTGTLTMGRPFVTAIRTRDCAHGEPRAEACAPCDDVVAVAASIEGASEHPVAHAIVAEASHRRIVQLPLAHNVQAHAGRGITGELADGRRIAVGSDALFASASDGRAQLAPLAEAIRNAGNTVMYVARDEAVIGYIGVQDRVRESTPAALTELKKAKPPVRTVMLTGDNAQVAARVATQLGTIDDVQANLLPAQKLAAIEKLHAEYGTVAMVGDGINDAPALARADVGIAMGHGGTAQAMETADVVLMRDDLASLPIAIRLSRSSRRLVQQNIALALGLKLAFLVLAVPGITTLWLAVVADVGATLLVTLNGMRILRQN